MTLKTYPDAAMADVIEVLLEADVDPALVKMLAADLHGEYETIYTNRAEATWEAMHDPERVAARGESYRRQMRDAGRGHLLGGK